MPDRVPSSPSPKFLAMARRTSRSRGNDGGGLMDDPTTALLQSQISYLHTTYIYSVIAGGEEGFHHIHIPRYDD